MPTQTDSRHTEAFAVALDCVSTPIFLVRTDGCIVHSNIAGSRMLNHGGALKQLYSRLTARRSSEAKALNAVLSRVFERQQPELLRLSSRNGTIRLLIKVNPVPGDALVTVCVVDLQATDEDLTHWIKAALQLSPQNAELAAGLITGLSLSEFSNQKAVTLGAARTRLKKLFAQTGRSSQAALVSVLLRAASIAPPQGDKKMSPR